MIQTISNVKIINPDTTIECADIIIENNYIKEIIPNNSIATKIAIPGFIDTHIKWNVQLWCNARERSFRTYFISFSIKWNTSFIANCNDKFLKYNTSIA
ncbi:hypothetical protein ONA24_06120 [Mycoplasmopsis cynos]|uniref:hypothetical protein n=1 Tax=Mycoplasmopsis cynos TaxID=171284 RepID=UPI0024CC1EFA|nr:hypothetical protein [Mycoplasmopsis cynos]WAM03282.1 hypothetical protein ONA22_06185 [Mycoplasmopsis cynos]WAM09540.1 hypothetical protein ONA24_06120 [Mycoplasmopsis cynos]